jgi:hypothetical protein
MLGIIGSVDRLVFSIRPNTRCGCTLSNVSGYYVDKRNFNSCNKMACMQNCGWSQPHCELKMGSTFINSCKILWVPKKFGKESLLFLVDQPEWWIDHWLLLIEPWWWLIHVWHLYVLKCILSHTYCLLVVKDTHLVHNLNTIISDIAPNVMHC